MDAAQTAGVFPIDVEVMGITLLAVSGHKGLLGPQGVGVLYLAPHLELGTLIEGGTGSRSESLDHPTTCPDRFEAGTMNCHGLAGLYAGARYLLEKGVDTVRAHEMRLWRRFRDGLKDIKEDNWIPPGSILTPHEGEFRMFFGMEGIPSNVKEMAKKNECVILKKGPVDVISDGKRVETNTIHNQGMTHGGTGDVLAGLVAALYCKNDAFTAAFAGARINGIAGNMAMKRYGFNFCASDVADNLSEAYRIFGKERK